MEFALAVDEYLAQFLALLYHPCGVFFRHAVDGGHHLFHFGHVDRTDGADALGVGIFDEVEAVVGILAVKGIARLDVLQFHGAADVTGAEFFHLGTVLSGTHEEL